MRGNLMWASGKMFPQTLCMKWIMMIFRWWHEQTFMSFFTYEDFERRGNQTRIIYSNNSVTYLATKSSV